PPSGSRFPFSPSVVASPSRQAAARPLAAAFVAAQEAEERIRLEAAVVTVAKKQSPVEQAVSLIGPDQSSSMLQLVNASKAPRPLALSQLHQPSTQSQSSSHAAASASALRRLMPAPAERIASSSCRPAISGDNVSLSSSFMAECEPPYPASPFRIIEPGPSSLNVLASSAITTVTSTVSPATAMAVTGNDSGILSHIYSSPLRPAISQLESVCIMDELPTPLPAYLADAPTASPAPKPPGGGLYLPMDEEEDEDDEDEDEDESQDDSKRRRLYARGKQQVNQNYHIKQLHHSHHNHHHKTEDIKQRNLQKHPDNLNGIQHEQPQAFTTPQVGYSTLITRFHPVLVFPFI
ncbi:unnamed protein product, partial [Protopolystoma xenopodis]